VGELAVFYPKIAVAYTQRTSFGCLASVLYQLKLQRRDYGNYKNRNSTHEGGTGS
jgi:hypothetical protein